MSKQFRIVISGSMNGKRRAAFSFTKYPVSASAAPRKFLEACDFQFEHMSYNGKYVVNGLYFEAEQTVFMWNTSNRRAVVIKVVPV